MDEMTIPWGKSKGTPLSQAGEKDLKWCLEFASNSVDNPEKAKFRDQNIALVAAIQAELARRAAGGPKAEAPKPAAQAPATAMVVQQMGDIVHVEGAYDDPRKATRALKAAAQIFHLVSPSPMCGSMPDGCEMAISVVMVDPVRETYNLTGSKDNPKPTDTVGLGRVALQRISGALGITWIEPACRRLDDGSNPRYCHYRMVGKYRAFDGQIIDLPPGDVEIDMRDGSDQVAEIRSKAKKRYDRWVKSGSRGYPPDDGESQIMEIRKFIERHARTKAMLVVIASMGVRRSYERSELDKGFACAKVMFTGKSEDPEAKKMYREKIADSFLQGSSQLYGQHAPQLPQSQTGHSPPPVGYDQRRTFDAEYDEIPEPEPSPQPVRTTRQTTTQDSQPAKTPSTPPPADIKSEEKPKTDQKLEGLPEEQDRGNDPEKY